MSLQCKSSQVHTHSVSLIHTYTCTHIHNTLSHMHTHTHTVHQPYGNECNNPDSPMQQKKFFYNFHNANNMFSLISLQSSFSHFFFSRAAFRSSVFVLLTSFKSFTCRSNDLISASLFLSLFSSFVFSLSLTCLY